MVVEKAQQMNLNVDFINGNLDLYPLVGGTHYGSGSNDRIGGIVTETSGDGRYTVKVERGSFNPPDEPPRKNEAKASVKRLISSRPIKSIRISASHLDRAAVGFELKSAKTHLAVYLSCDGYVNATLENRHFVFDARLPEGDKPHSLRDVGLSVKITAPTVTVFTISRGREKEVCSLHLDALTTVTECEVCLAVTLECPALCEIENVKFI